MRYVYLNNDHLKDKRLKMSQRLRALIRRRREQALMQNRKEVRHG